MARNSKPEVKTDYSAASRVVKAAIATYNPANYPFTKVSQTEMFPDAVVPWGIGRGSRDHAAYLVAACSLDANRKATEVYLAAQDLASKVASLGLPMSRLHEVPEQIIREVLEKRFGIPRQHTRMVDKPIHTLQNNSRTIAEKYGGDPRNMYKEDVWKTIDIIDQLRYFGLGKAALLVKNFTRFKMWPYDPSEIPIKIDRHAIKISVANGVVDLQGHQREIEWPLEKPKALKIALETSLSLGHFAEEDLKAGKVLAVRTDRFIEPLMRVYQQVTKQKGISAIDLNDALWAIGSYFCRLNREFDCRMGCEIKCTTRSPSDNIGVWLFTNAGEDPIDKRREPKHPMLF